MTIDIKMLEGYPVDDIIEKLCTIPSDQPPFPVETFERRLKHQRGIFGCYAFDDDMLVAYKIGFEPRPRYFESWMGAVAHEYRRQGLAARLMVEQHKWCTERGYRIISTITDASNRAMLILNLKSGFVIAGTHMDRGENHQVLLQKRIDTEGDST